MIIALFLILLYLSFAVDFLLWPIPSEASTQAMLKRAKQRYSVHHVFLRICHIGLLALWLYPLYTAIITLWPPASLGLSVAKPLSPHWFAWVGLLMALAGRLITLRASRIIRQAEADTLLDYSVFRLSRHPIVLGLHLTLAGMLCTTGNLWLLLLYPFSVLYFDFKIRVEEVELYKRFGAPYSVYAGRTPRYLKFWSQKN